MSREEMLLETKRKRQAELAGTTFEVFDMGDDAVESSSGTGAVGDTTALPMEELPSVLEEALEEGSSAGSGEEDGDEESDAGSTSSSRLPWYARTLAPLTVEEDEGEDDDEGEREREPTGSEDLSGGHGASSMESVVPSAERDPRGDEQTVLSLEEPDDSQRTLLNSFYNFLMLRERSPILAEVVSTWALTKDSRARFRDNIVNLIEAIQKASRGSLPLLVNKQLDEAKRVSNPNERVRSLLRTPIPLRDEVKVQVTNAIVASFVFYHWPIAAKAKDMIEMWFQRPDRGPFVYDLESTGRPRFPDNRCQVGSALAWSTAFDITRKHFAEQKRVDGDILSLPCVILSDECTGGSVQHYPIRMLLALGCSNDTSMEVPILGMLATKVGVVYRDSQGNVMPSEGISEKQASAATKAINRRCLRLIFDELTKETEIVCVTGDTTSVRCVLVWGGYFSDGKERYTMAGVKPDLSTKGEKRAVYFFFRKSDGKLRSLVTEVETIKTQADADAEGIDWAARRENPMITSGTIFKRDLFYKMFPFDYLHHIKGCIDRVDSACTYKSLCGLALFQLITFFYGNNTIGKAATGIMTSSSDQLRSFLPYVVGMAALLHSGERKSHEEGIKLCVEMCMDLLDLFALALDRAAGRHSEAIYSLQLSIDKAARAIEGMHPELSIHSIKFVEIVTMAKNMTLFWGRGGNFSTSVLEKGHLKVKRNFANHGGGRVRGTAAHLEFENLQTLAGTVDALGAANPGKPLKLYQSPPGGTELSLEYKLLHVVEDRTRSTKPDDVVPVETVRSQLAGNLRTVLNKVFAVNVNDASWTQAVDCALEKLMAAEAVLGQARALGNGIRLRVASRMGAAQLLVDEVDVPGMSSSSFHGLASAQAGRELMRSPLRPSSADDKSETCPDPWCLWHRGVGVAGFRAEETTTQYDVPVLFVRFSGDRYGAVVVRPRRMLELPRRQVWERIGDFVRVDVTGVELFVVRENEFRGSRPLMRGGELVHSKGRKIRLEAFMSNVNMRQLLATL